MKYTILHEIPGRVRVHCRAVQFTPECRLELTRWVDSHRGLLSASMSLRTGNLVVRYSGEISRDALHALLHDLELFGVTTLACPRERKAVKSFSETALSAAGKEAARCVVGLLPPPLRTALGMFRTAGRIIDLAAAAARYDFAAFCRLACKLLFFALFGGTLPGRICIAFAGIAFRQPSAPAAPSQASELPPPDERLALPCSQPNDAFSAPSECAG